ncbi:MAG: hypothetical protein PHV93_00895 [Candidatus Pacebacteria bacterium]|nr:hypothetical protein [Candidatus Paceibacterota bacterium]
MVAREHAVHLESLYTFCFKRGREVLWFDLMGLVWYALNYQRFWALRTQAEKEEKLCLAVKLVDKEVAARKEFEGALADFCEECEREGLQVDGNLSPFDLCQYEVEIRRRGK